MATMTVKEYASTNGLTIWRVYYLIRKGEVKFRKSGNTYLITTKPQNNGND